MSEREASSVAERRDRVAAVPPAWESIDWRRHGRDAWIGGRRLHYVDYGTGPALLLLHGLGMSWQWWLRNLPALGEHCRVIAVDLPGFGQSDSLPRPAEMATHAEVLLGLIDQLELNTVTVAGHSMGGLIALGMAEQDPSRVARVILVNAGGVPLTETRLRMVVATVGVVCGVISRPSINRAMTLRPRLRNAVLRFGLHDAAAVSPALAAQVMASLPGLGFLDAIGAAAARVQTGVVPVACPVLLIWGAYDRLLPLAAARHLASLLPDARLEVLNGAGHTPMVEEPEAFNRFVIDFITGEAT